jgi:uncharacterized membrane protein YGL010W
MNPSTESTASTETRAAELPLRRVDQLLAHYAQSHQNPTNELIHYTAIPCIMLSLVGLLYVASPLLALLFLGASLVYYWRLSTVFLVTMVGVTVAMLAIIAALNAKHILLPVCVTVFVVAWIFQFIGHRIEGKKPSFFEDVQYLWVGPLFVLSRLFTRLGVRW